MKKWFVDYSLTLSVGRVIAADTEEEAKEIAEQMLYGDGGDAYWEDITGSMEYDTDSWRKKYCEIDSYGEAPNELKADNEAA